MKAAELAKTERDQVAESVSSAARERARIRKAEIDLCWMCDEDGQSANGLPCQHNEYTALAAKKGMAAVRAALNDARKGKGNGIL